MLTASPRESSGSPFQRRSSSSCSCSVRRRAQRVSDRLAVHLIGDRVRRADEVVTRPVRRIEVLLGKWLGLALLLAGYAAAVCASSSSSSTLVSGFVPPNPALAAVYLFAEGTLLLTLAIALSTRLPVIAAGVVGVAVFGAGWLARVVGSLGNAFNIAALRTIGRIGRVLLQPTGLWRGADLLPRASIGVRCPLHAADPSSSSVHQPGRYLLWVVFWFRRNPRVGAFSFQRREM